MKKNYTSFFTFCTVIVLVVTFSNLHAQVINKSTLYVKDNSNFHVKSGNFSFASPATTRTTRTAVTYGVISLGATSTTSGQSNSHYVDGYTRYYGTTSLIIPCGDGGVYAPAKIIPTASTGVDVAYKREAPSVVSAALNANVAAISTVEYWKLKGTPTTKVTLSWRASSNIATLLAGKTLNYVTIVGYNGSQWIDIPSFFDANSVYGSSSTATQGSITSTASFDLTAYTDFSIGILSDNVCYPVVLSSGNTKTWNGTWSPSAPEFNDPVVINAPFSGSLTCFSVQLNADITLDNTDVMDVYSSFTETVAGTNKVIMSSDAILMQRDNNAIAPKIAITKRTRPMRRFDYLFLSSPIVNFATFFTDLNDPLKTSPAQLPGATTFIPYPAPFYYYSTDLNATNVPVTSSNVTRAQGFTAAVGYNQLPWANTSTPNAWNDEKYPIDIRTEGLTNNGVVPVENMPSGQGWFRLGNPYPSPINADKLLIAMGDNIRKTLYFWTFNTPRANYQNTALNSGNYTAQDYATYNLTGAAAASGGAIPNGKINTMQSVYIRKLNNVVSPAYTFDLNNCLRDITGNDQFFRPAQESSIGKFRLNLTGSEQSFSQILVGYNPIATLDYDNGYDSPRMPGGLNSELNSLIGNSSTSYVIQTRSTFSETDVVPLRFTNRTQETYTISLANREGFFNTDPITIYLHDTFTNVYHDLAQGAYSFTAASGVDNTRFRIVYQNSNLGVGDTIIDNAFANINNDVFIVKANRMIQKVQLFDLTGRIIKTYDNVSNTEMSDAFNHAQAVYLAKITLDNNVVVTQKIINN